MSPNMRKVAKCGTSVKKAERCYGYVMTKNFAGIDLSRILPDEEWIKGAELPDVDIVFISKSLEPNIGQVVVGWYKNATVFHKEYRKRRGSKKQGDWDNIDYLCEVSDENATLLQAPDRTFQIPRGKGFPGQSNVWYENKKIQMLPDSKDNFGSI